MYFCIDMKCFFASVECSLRGLNPYTTPLVVADKTRGKGALCLAISPYLKALGVKNRCRLYEIPNNYKYIIAKPRMKKYIEFAGKIHSIFLRYVPSHLIHTYSIDEAFLDVSGVMHLYGGYINLALSILKDIKDELKITAACGAGDNLFLSKLALDLKAKKSFNNFYYLSSEDFFEEVWFIKSLTDIWQIGNGIERRLHKLNLFDLHDIAICDKEILYKEFGVIGLDLHEHAWGIDNTTIEDIKSYKPLSKSLSRNQILFRDYSKDEALIPLLEMLYLLCLDLFKNKILARSYSFFVGYSDKGYYVKTFSLDIYTDDYYLIKDELKQYYQQVKNFPIRRIGISCYNLTAKEKGFNTLFYEPNDRYNRLCSATLDIWNRYGKNKLVIGTALLEESTLYQRNEKIGGHNSD